MICAEEILAKQGMKPPVYMSGNIAGGRERNRALIDKYRPRIKNLWFLYFKGIINIKNLQYELSDTDVKQVKWHI